MLILSKKSIYRRRIPVQYILQIETNSYIRTHSQFVDKLGFSMNTSDELFQLIRSLSMQEKRHFKIFAKGSYMREGDNNYLRLFDAIEKQRRYDEKKIKARFRGETFIKHLPSEKHYLFSLILRSLRNYHSETNTDVRIKELLIDAEVLQQKSLPGLCRKTLRKAKKLAYRYERLAFIPEIVRLESRLFDLASLDDVYTEEQAALQKITKVNRYRALSNKMARLVATAHHLRKSSELKALAAVMKDPLMKEEKQADTFTAKIYYFYIKGVYFGLKGDLRNGYLIRKRFVDIIEAEKELLEIQARNYLSALNNLAISEMELEKFEDAMVTVTKIRELPRHTKAGRAEDVRISSFIFSSILEMNIHIRTRQYENSLEVVKQTEEGLKSYEGKIHPQFLIVLHNSIKYIYFGTGEFKKALQWSNKVIANNDPGIRDDIKAMARIFNLILHFELGNTDHMEYIIPSTYRFLLKSQRLYKVETVILHYLKRSAHLGSKKEILASFRKLYRELLPLAKDPYEKKAFEEFDIIAWLAGKIG